MRAIVRERFKLHPMNQFSPARLDVSRFAEAGATLSGVDPLSKYPRLATEAEAPTPDLFVQWTAVGGQRQGSLGTLEPWLHLSLDVTLPLVCQCCLGPVATGLQVDRWFRFVADEAAAEAQDEEADEDVLATSQEFDLYALMEDELLMEIPVTPRHDTCPQAPRLTFADADFDEAGQKRPHPFAVLGALHPRKPDSAG